LASAFGAVFLGFVGAGAGGAMLSMTGNMGVGSVDAGGSMARGGTGGTTSVGASSISWARLAVQAAPHAASIRSRTSCFANRTV
jgi:hypothetical protein